MKAILLDGSHESDHAGERVGVALLLALQAGLGLGTHRPARERDRQLRGRLLLLDPVSRRVQCGRRQSRRRCGVVASDLMVYLTPVTFGGYSSVLKRMVDHQIQNVSPFFATAEGETHHQQRYPKYPDFLAAGWMDAPDAQAEAVFRHLSRRNAINFFAQRAVSGVVSPGQSDAEILATVQRWLDDLQKGGPSLYLHTVLGSPEKVKALLDAVDGADLVTLAFPLYVDSLPAPVIEGLERAAHRRGRERTRRQLFTAIANCGFPEAHHNATALAICDRFAREAGSTGRGHWRWAAARRLMAGHWPSWAGAPSRSGSRCNWRPKRWRKDRPSRKRPRIC